MMLVPKKKIIIIKKKPNAVHKALSLWGLGKLDVRNFTLLSGVIVSTFWTHDLQVETEKPYRQFQAYSLMMLFSITFK